jgi:hypothetical protein
LINACPYNVFSPTIDHIRGVGHLLPYKASKGDILMQAY